MPKKHHFRKRERWLAHRPKFIGASESPVVLGYSYADSGLLDLYASKVSDADDDDDRFGPEVQERMELGLAVEGGLLHLLSEKLEVSIKQQKLTTYISDDYEYIGATPDGLIDDKIPVELKNVGAFAVADWKDGNTPPMFLIQLQHQMCVMGSEYGYIAANLANAKLVYRKVERDEEYLALMVQELTRFWDLVANKTPPAPDFSEACRSALHRMYPVSDPSKAIELPMAACEVLDKRDEAKAAEKKAKEESRGAENMFKAAMGEATHAVLGDGRIIKWATEQGKPDQFCPHCGEQTAKGFTRRVFRVVKTLKTERLDYVEANPVPGLTHQPDEDPGEQTTGGLPRPAGDVHDGGDKRDGNSNSGDRPELPFQSD